MPRPKKATGVEPKKRSRNGCWPCKNRKIKCGEEKPKCLNCERQGETCDYSIRLNWEGRTKKKITVSADNSPAAVDAFQWTPDQNATSFDFTFGQFSTIDTTAARPELTSRTTDTTMQSPLGGSDMPTLDRTISDPQTYQGSFSISTPQTQQASSRTSSNASMAANRLRSESNLADHIPTTVDGRPRARPGNNLARRNSNQNSQNNPMLSLDSLNTGQPINQSIYSPTQRNPLAPSLDFSNAYSSARLGIQAHSASPPRSAPPGQTVFPPPPQRRNSDTLSSDAMEPSSPGQRDKRQRMSRDYEVSLMSTDYNMLPPTSMHLSTPDTRPPMLATHPAVNGAHSSIDSFSPINSAEETPLTPAESAASEENMMQKGYGTHPGMPRSFSVNSMLSGPSAEALEEDMLNNGRQRRLSHHKSGSFGTDDAISYGLDRGLPDLDIPKNNDEMAISITTPELLQSAVDDYLGIRSDFDDFRPNEFGFGTQAKRATFEKGDYYAKPVPVKIPRALGVLPDELTQNPMNMLYFHHFLNHTARILVPHDCSENPFKNLLPRMAVADINLLNLLLAYSASHRARLLNHPEPANRIAFWVRNVFPELRKALHSENIENLTNSNLATAIMLASLEIISPNTFEVPVPWQWHLDTARQMIVARGGAAGIHKRDKVSYFLSRWFAYLDVMGSLSGGKNDKPLFSGNYWQSSSDDNEDEDDDEYQIDCLLGFTSRCVTILAKVAELARHCDGERILDGEIRPDWRPSPDVVRAAEKLQNDLQEARTHEYRGCPHRGSNAENEQGWDSLEMVATNEAFHWAGVVHLQRRVLGKPSLDPEVQRAVREIVGALFKVRKGGTAEACLLFPMFTAGCDAKNQQQRDKIMDRIKSVEQFGMTQVHKARTLMQKVWDTGKPWETLVSGEFFG